MPESARFREAFKISLAFVLAYGVSLSLDWNNVHWAGLAIAMCALSTSGEALRKGILRVGGTVLGAIVALIFMSFTLQDRWLYVLLTTVWVGFCAWKSMDSTRGYFWVLAGFVVPLMTIMSGSESQQAFQVAILRVQQTGLGIVAYTLVATFIFPAPSRQSFELEVTQQLRTMSKLFVDACHALPGNEDREDEPVSDEVRRATAQAHVGLLPKLDAAALESFEVADVRRQWSSLIADLSAFYGTLERWRLTLSDLPAAGFRQSLIGIDSFNAEIDRRLNIIVAILADGNAEISEKATGLFLEDNTDLPTFDRAAIVAAHHHMMEIDRLSGRMLATAAEIRDLPNVIAGRNGQPAKAPVGSKLRLPDPERLASTAFAMTTVVLFCLTYFYLPSLPSPPLMFGMGTALALILASTPFVPLLSVAKAGFIGLLIGWVFHLIIMPHIEGFDALGGWLFAAVFAICWIWHGPSGGLQRSMGLAFLVAVSSIDNQQTFSFTGAINFGVQMFITFAIFAITLSVPITFKNAIVFRRLVRRYFGSLNTLLETMHIDRREARTWWESQRRAYHLHQVRTIPARLLPWLMYLPTAAASPEDKKSLQGFVQSLDLLNNKVEDLLTARDLSYTDETVTQLLMELRAWREAIQTVSKGLAEGREEFLQPDYRTRLDVRMSHLEELLREIISSGAVGSENVSGDQSLYRLLGAFRGISEALLGVVEPAAKVDWTRFREARF